jgi:signal transduction histidine kinase
MEEQLDATQEILKAGQHMLSLVNDILDLSKLASGKMEFHLAPVDPGHVLESAVAGQREQARHKSIHLTLELRGALPICILDGRRLQQMILNYLSNALKFTSPGGCVTVQATVAERSSIIQHPACLEQEALATVDHFLEVCVADTGIGIAPEHQARLFRRFEQVDSSLNRQHQGTGLGLALVKTLAEHQGGAVGLLSSPGSGSRFYFWLPVVAELQVRQVNGSQQGDTPAAV